MFQDGQGSMSDLLVINFSCSLVSQEEATLTSSEIRSLVYLLFFYSSTDGNLLFQNLLNIQIKAKNMNSNRYLFQR